jgi:hypothetical protein
LLKFIFAVATEFTRCLLLPSSVGAFLYRAPPCSGYRAHSVSFGYRVVSLHLPRSLGKLSCLSVPLVTELIWFLWSPSQFDFFGYRVELSLGNSCCRENFFRL